MNVKYFVEYMHALLHTEEYRKTYLPQAKGRHKQMYLNLIESPLRNFFERYRIDNPVRFKEMYDAFCSAPMGHNSFLVTYGTGGTERKCVLPSWGQVVDFHNLSDTRKYDSDGYTTYITNVELIPVSSTGPSLTLVHEDRYNVALEDGDFTITSHRVCVNPPLGPQYQDWYNKPSFNSDMTFHFWLSGSKEYVEANLPTLKADMDALRQTDKWKAYMLRMAHDSNHRNWVEFGRYSQYTPTIFQEKEYLVSLEDGSDALVFMTGVQIHAYAALSTRKDFYIWRSADTCTEAL